MRTIEKLRPNWPDLQSDAVAGLTFAIVSVPQAMAHALLATVNPVLGIFTLVAAVPIGALFTGSMFMNVSTTAALSIAAGAGLEEVVPDQRTAALATLALLVGVFQFLAGVFRLGFLVRFISNAVMTGFLNGVGVLIILGQLGDLTGYRSSFSNAIARALDLLLRLHEINLPTTFIGGLTLGLIVVLLRTRLRKFAFILAIGASTLSLAVLSLPAMGMSSTWAAVRTVGDVGSIPQALPQLVIPAPGTLVAMLVPAFSVAVIGLIQGAGVSQGFPNPDGSYPDVSRDFLGQGVANIATGFVGGLPAGGSISGTALIASAGAKSRWTNILAGLFVVLIVLAAAPIAERVPLPALAALLIVAGFQGLRLEEGLTVWKTARLPAAAETLTFVATLTLPLQYAVLIGMAFSILLNAAHQANKLVVKEWVLARGAFPEERPAPKALPSGQLTVLQIYGSLFFAGAKSLEDMLPAPDSATRAVIALALRGTPEIGSTFIAVLRRYADALKARNCRLMLVGVDPAVRDQLARTGLLQKIGEENVFLAEPQLGSAMNKAGAAAQRWIENGAET